MPPIPSFYIKEIDSIIALIFPFDPIFIDRFDLLLVVATTNSYEEYKIFGNKSSRIL